MIGTACCAMHPAYSFLFTIQQLECCSLCHRLRQCLWCPLLCNCNQDLFKPPHGLHTYVAVSGFQLYHRYHYHCQCCVIADEDPFDFPVHTFYGTKDARVSAHMVQGWQRFTTGAFSCDRIDGNHLWPLDKAPKLQWLQSIVVKMQATL